MKSQDIQDEIEAVEETLAGLRKKLENSKVKTVKEMPRNFTFSVETERRGREFDCRKRAFTFWGTGNRGCREKIQEVLEEYNCVLVTCEDRNTEIMIISNSTEVR